MVTARIFRIEFLKFRNFSEISEKPCEFHAFVTNGTVY